MPAQFFGTDHKSFLVITVKVITRYDSLSAVCANINIFLDGTSRGLHSVRNFRLLSKLQGIKFLKTLSTSHIIRQTKYKTIKFLTPVNSLLQLNKS